MSGKMRLFRNVLIAATGLLVLGIVLALGSCCKPDASGSHRHASAAASDGGCCAPRTQVASHEHALPSESSNADAPAAEPVPAHNDASPSDAGASVAEPAPVSADQPRGTVAVAEQTTCPVLGGAIDKSIFTDYQGKKVYFCCKGCPDVFAASPGKYVTKLPQFAA